MEKLTVFVVIRIQYECDTCGSGGGIEGVFFTREDAEVKCKELEGNRFCGSIQYDVEEQVAQ